MAFTLQMPNCMNGQRVLSIETCSEAATQDSPWCVFLWLMWTGCAIKLRFECGIYSVVHFKRYMWCIVYTLIFTQGYTIIYCISYIQCLLQVAGIYLLCVFYNSLDILCGHSGAVKSCLLLSDSPSWCAAQLYINDQEQIDPIHYRLLIWLTLTYCM